MFSTCCFLLPRKLPTKKLRHDLDRWEILAVLIAVFLPPFTKNRQSSDRYEKIPFIVSLEVWKSWALFHRHVATLIWRFKNPAKAPLTAPLIASEPSTAWTSLEIPYRTWPPFTSSMAFFGHQLVELRGHLATSKRFAKTVVFRGRKNMDSQLAPVRGPTTKQETHLPIPMFH